MSFAHRLLAHPGLFRFFNALIGQQKPYQLLVQDYLQLQPGQSLLDIGCGMADILNYVPAIRYVGFDSHPDYVQAAQRHFGSRGTFHCKTLEDNQAIESQTFDRVLAKGVLHHLPDEEAIRLFQIARRALRPGGRLITFDGVFVQEQSFLSRFILSQDRGKFVRTPVAYVRLARQVFEEVSITIYHDLIRIPYTHAILRCGVSEH